MFTKLKCMYILFASLVAAFHVQAHEYWLQPENFRLQAEDNIRANIRVGQHFKGDSYAYLPDELEYVNIYLADVSKAVKGRFGDIPAFNLRPLGEGLNILSVSTQPFKLTYTDEGKFEKFLKYDGLEWVLKEHEKRGLPETGFTEAYRRHAKALLKVGNGEGSDRRTGLEFEWVMQTNPYTDTGDTLTAQLWWREQVFSNAAFRVFVLKDGKVSEATYKTDDNGMATFPRTKDATYMVNAVHMLIPAAEIVQTMGAVWESRWASVTFFTP